MDLIRLRDAHSASWAEVAPGVGFNCVRLEVEVGDQTISVLETPDGVIAGTDRPSRGGIPILFPFPNRLAKGRFVWQGKLYQIEPNTPQGHAIHGLCFDRPWRVIERDSHSVTGQFQLSVDAPERMKSWPADFLIEAQYELIHRRLRLNVRIQNMDEVPLPWGLATHPWFRVPLTPKSDRDQCLIEVPAERRWILEEQLPTGTIVDVESHYDLREGRRLAGLQLDDVLTDIVCLGPQFECVLIDPVAGLQVTQTCPPIFREIVVYTPPAPRQAICVEPYSCTSNAMNLEAIGVEAGVRVLEPGREFHTWIDITAGPILV